jgi:hypothetical protein
MLDIDVDRRRFENETPLDASLRSPVVEEHWWRSITNMGQIVDGSGLFPHGSAHMEAGSTCPFVVAATV